MIGFFPQIYEDELLYSQLCRYYQRTGYIRYIYACDDLYMRRTVHPSIEFVNEYTTDAMCWITKDKSFEDIILDHTMYPAYCRFLPKERRIAAFNSLCQCDGIYHNLISNQEIGGRRYLRYCPLCAKEDRKRYGETYWHRAHQILHSDVCPKHRCYLMDSSIPIGGKVSPGLYPAEIEVPEDSIINKCDNEKLIDFARYIFEIFHSPIDLECDMPIGSYLHQTLDRKYLSGSGIRTDINSLYTDYSEFISPICEPMTFAMFQKIYSNLSWDHHKILQVAYFQGIPISDIIKLPETLIMTPMEPLYQCLSEQYNIPYQQMTEIGNRIINVYRRTQNVSRKSGPKQRDWARIDEEYLPRVKEIVNRIYNDGGRPGKVSVGRVEREMGVPSRQFKKLPRCTEYITGFLETQNEYRARQVIWAVKTFQTEGRMMTKNSLNKLLYFRKNDLTACFPYITDPEVQRVVQELITA